MQPYKNFIFLSKMKFFDLAIPIITFNETYTEWSENIANMSPNAPFGRLEKTRASAARPIARSAREKNATWPSMENYIS